MVNLVFDLENGKNIELSVDEARDLYRQLHSLFGVIESGGTKDYHAHDDKEPNEENPDTEKENPYKDVIQPYIPYYPYIPWYPYDSWWWPYRPAAPWTEPIITYVSAT